MQRSAFFRVASVLGFLLLCVQTEVALAGAADVRAFVECIRDSGAKYYGAHWCPYCSKQNNLFGAEAQYLPYVECSSKDGERKLQQCSHIRGYPTWIFSDGKQVSSVLSVAELSAYTGCQVTEKDYFLD